jgi:hypothetical protein
MRWPRRGAAAGLLPLVLLILAGCTSAASPSPIGPAASPATPASPTPGAATAQFNLFLDQTPAQTASFSLFVQTSPAAIDETARTFCGTGGGDTPPCDSSPYPFTIRIENLPVGGRLDYRFERHATNGTVEVLSQGSAPLDRALVREVTYPAIGPTP